MAGIAALAAVKRSPSHEMLRKVGTKIDGVYAVPNADGFRDIEWPEAAASALVIAVSHPENEPELDWFDASGGSPGNLKLVKINRELSAWIEQTHRIRTRKLPYQVEDGGIYLKDVAALAGLGCIGRNNLLITRELGSRVRLRGMLLEAELAPTDSDEFDPCSDCEEPCRTACPQAAFAERAHASAQAGTTDLPARDGKYARSRCMMQMTQDIMDSGAAFTNDSMSITDTDVGATSDNLIKWCRRCELACPVGR